MEENQGKRSDIVLSVSVLMLVSVYVGHMYLDELVLGVQWVATEYVTPIFDLDLYF